MICQNAIDNLHQSYASDSFLIDKIFLGTFIIVIEHNKCAEVRMLFNLEFLRALRKDRVAVFEWRELGSQFLCRARTCLDFKFMNRRTRPVLMVQWFRYFDQ